MKTEFEAIFFDIGGTLRIQHKDEEYANAAKRKIVELLGIDEDPIEFCKFLDYRYEGYRKWAFDEMKEAAETELWGKWLGPEFPKALIEEKAIELTYQYRQIVGPRFLVKDALKVVQELEKRGYKLGIISNLISSTEIPEWLINDGLAPHFKTVILSAVCGLRKPDPEMYLVAARDLGVDPAKCAYIGDNLDRDVTGAKIAGFGMNVIFISPEKLAKKKVTDENRPEAIVHEFIEILDIFPEAPKVNVDAMRKV